MIEFLSLSQDDLPHVSHLAVHPDQVKFSGTIEEAFAATNPDVDRYAITDGTAVVGFFKIDRDYSTVHGFASTSDLGLRTVMVDANHQGRGIGQALCRALPAYLAQRYPNAASLWLTVNLLNPRAVSAYIKGGFVDTGEHWVHGDFGPQHIMRLALAPTSTANPSIHAG
ncbi:GNAT family N-acetyltransferase [Pseudosulfitobacter koreensis]|uniref:GNAT family N-acetyltransferase n=1 Tax=Pseudosulfitobacter koreensis TaxID=2968472 RepID=A0ABT1YZJ1_9RHOB|nr:GNAT family N-acetyltransferase [Pseudosulfitobacter koreense]MCR8826304.1 GNAT family N-acetyltransferase [Pseudosulfitobacter koreense]